MNETLKNGEDDDRAAVELARILLDLGEAAVAVALHSQPSDICARGALRSPSAST